MPPDAVAIGDRSVRLQSVLHSLGLVVAAFIVGIGLSLVGLYGLAALGVTVQIGDQIPAEVSAVLSALQYVGFIGVCLWYLYWRNDADDLFSISVPGLRQVGWAVLGLVGLFVLLNILSVIITALGLTTAENAAITTGREQPVLLLYMLVVTIVFVAPGEELLFRGLVQGLFRRAYGVIPGLVLASTLFGVVHYIALVGTGSRAVYIVIAAALGLVLGLLYERTQNLVVPMLVHGAYNAIIFYVNYLIATGAVEVPA